MNRNEIAEHLLNSSILSRWHWFKPHFILLKQDRDSLFAQSIIDTLYQIGEKLPAVPMQFIKRLAGFSGKVNNPRQYEQLMQALAEMLILRQVLYYDWKEPVQFIWEPKSKYSSKAPEINIQLQDITLGLEVKSPSFLVHENPNALKKTRQGLKDRKLSNDFNPTKNFLISANEKFCSFKQDDPDYLSILIMVWDEHVHEPVSSLLNSKFGIFQTSPHPYSMVDGVIITQHRAKFEALANKSPSLVEEGLLNYGTSNREPYKIFIKNPSSRNNIPTKLLDCFQAIVPHLKLGSRYDPENSLSWRKFENQIISQIK